MYIYVYIYICIYTYIHIYIQCIKDVPVLHWKVPIRTDSNREVRFTLLNLPLAPGGKEPLKTHMDIYLNQKYAEICIYTDMHIVIES
jgi:hypothetical protein